MKTKDIVYAAVGGALAFIIMRLTAFPLFASATFLKMEFSEVPLLLLSVLVSPVVGLCSLLIKDVLLFCTGSNIFGAISDFLAGGIFILLFSLIVGKQGGPKRVLAASLIAPVGRMLFSIPLNLVILRLQFGTAPGQVMAMMPVLLPFNFIKSLLGVVCFALLYPRLRRAAPWLGCGDDKKM
ncbi:MAG: hypothetical protein LBN26_05435 [Christensenellaceae bacterium]|jgi:riboflavin transporter FmnP|nr:hypothetical protein [Christensenellaceae bacterium]